MFVSCTTVSGFLWPRGRRGVFALDCVRQPWCTLSWRICGEFLKCVCLQVLSWRTVPNPSISMSHPAKLRIILKDHNIRKLDLPHGIPGTVEELESIVKDTFEVDGKFTLHYKDADFGEEYFSLTSTGDIKDKDTLKVVQIIEPPTVTLTFSDVDSSFISASETLVNASAMSETSSVSCGTSCSSGSQDTVILSSPEHLSQRLQRWPTSFSVPRFAYDTELLLASGNEAFKKDGTKLNFIPVLPDILEKLAETIFQYVAYPTSAQLADVAEALVRQHPCLKEPGSYNGCYGWQQRLKYKMGNYRSKLRGLGCLELDVNSLKRKQAHEKTPSKNLKKPRKAEVNYLPPNPQGETEESLEKERLQLLDEVKKRNNYRIISEKMAKTFSSRRQEVVNLAPPVSDFKSRWPALFDATQINDEFQRITTVNLETTFMAKLDQYSARIMSLASSKAGAAKIKIERIRNMLQESSVEIKREVAIRCLMVYLKEKEEDLFREQLDGEEQFPEEVVKIVVTRRAAVSLPAIAKIVIEGTAVLEDLDVPRACALMMGLIYALNLSYPKQVKNTLEVFQKVFLELDGLKASPRVMSLKCKLLL
ncbi:sterile alpha motif domain-containing protein 3 isoform X3 [Oreochromis niloticus]|uniref:sterile alpha motif domain-containing protein 3 isoform X3 n=1 Tax=Oreochromis niloticus TaxID=8128 RepID=UPI00090560EA|nr:sterile alpha motif domain-containing protein 3-like isoform X3 [Oreochromis niloticus]